MPLEPDLLREFQSGAAGLAHVSVDEKEYVAAVVGDV